MGAVYLKMVQEQDTLRQNAYKSDAKKKYTTTILYEINMMMIAPCKE